MDTRTPEEYVHSEWVIARLSHANVATICALVLSVKRANPPDAPAQEEFDSVIDALRDAMDPGTWKILAESLMRNGAL